jgi:hypothetical protein
VHALVAALEVVAAAAAEMSSAVVRVVHKALSSVAFEQGRTAVEAEVKMLEHRVEAFLAARNQEAGMVDAHEHLEVRVGMAGPQEGSWDPGNQEEVR